MRLRDEGFRAIKLRVDKTKIDEGLATVEAVRAAVGESMEIMVDLNQGWRMPGDTGPLLDHATVASVAARLRELDVFWLEEPLPREDVKGYAALRHDSGLRIAGGEMARTTGELEAFETADALDVYQPDAVLSVGMLRERELAERVTARRHFFTPHTWTNGIGLLANLHAALAFSTCPYLEVPFDPPTWSADRRDWLLPVTIEIDDDGTVRDPGGTGLGVIPDFDELERFRIG